MDNVEKVNVLQAMIDPDGKEELNPEVLTAYLALVQSEILNRMYPFGIPPGVDRVPDRYEMLQLQCALFLWNKQGAEGQSQHSENGVTRTYAGAGLPEAWMQQITPRGVVY